MHMLPRVAELEERFPTELVVVGVHSGKYPAERRTENIRAACARLGVEHAVVNDRQFRVWRDYGVSAWPTLAIVSPDGYVLAEQAGELPTQALADAIGGIVADYDREGLLDRSPLPFRMGGPVAPEPSGPLRFPTRMALSGDLLYLSDSGHDRILELRLAEDGASADVVRMWGGQRGFADGGPGEARFDEPQGLARVGDALLVADRRNHAVRAVDLSTDDVRTLAGTGELGGWGDEGGPALGTALRSPFDVLPADDGMAVAMAGSHQLWWLDVQASRAEVLAGTGGEDIIDGPPRQALLAQPMGLASDGARLYFADSESSAVRYLDEGMSAVRSVIGTGLFDHGDRDGIGEDALLQHPQSLAWHADALLVADTYNDKVKRIDPVTRESRAMPGAAGSGEELWEPSGIASDGRRVFVADTNHHRVCLLREDGSLAEVTLA